MTLENKKEESRVVEQKSDGTIIVTIKPHGLSENGQKVLEKMLAGNPQVPGEDVCKGLIQPGEFD